jgi:DNA-directed RNA polymerase subunit beta'
LLVGDQIEKGRFEDLNLSLVDEGKRPVIAEPMLLGITKASYDREFISAASFQETTKVLTAADSLSAG